ncbi:PilZ domain-containing protein [Sphingobium cupriresistens]|uniref:PilZ domain-containing protein n=1 Tax=Sphingobium cupriresistens TaxID=1132417 RepID=A0A8G1ZE14_9SPHN|nr:PilZ domain-containing protein [Sphingobium cupriresistens]RYM06428.1 PilZ domain-containing protein [Sphingobium cupriresistens]
MERISYRPRTEYRKEPRYAADIKSVLIWEGMREPVTIRNISAYGALLEGFHFPPINTRITLITDKMEVCATVIWRGADRCGLLLTSPIEPLEVLRERPIRTVENTRTPPITLHRIGRGLYA